MLLSLPQVLALAAHCAPASQPQTLAAIAKVESGFDSLAIGVNGRAPIRLHPQSPAAASAIAERLIARGASLDLGLGQINSKNLAALGVTPGELFDPCRNLEASARVLQDGLERALAAPQPGRAPLSTALSYYNTGAASRGLANGYVAKVSTALAQIDLSAGRAAPAPTVAAAVAVAPDSAAARPAWAVFDDPSASESFVITPTPRGDQP